MGSSASFPLLSRAFLIVHPPLKPVVTGRVLTTQVFAKSGEPRRVEARGGAPAFKAAGCRFATLRA